MIGFASADPSVVRAVRQRELLNAWLRARGGRHGLPRRSDYQPDRIADELVDMMEFEVHGEGEQARFLITQEGARLTKTYGSEHVEPAKRTNRWLDDAIGAERYALVYVSTAPASRTSDPRFRFPWCRTPTARTSPMSGCCCRSAAAAGSSRSSAPTRAISIEGGFKIRNLMGLRPKGRARDPGQGDDRSGFRRRPVEPDRFR